MNVTHPANTLALPQLDIATARRRHLLSERELKRLRLLPGAPPVACVLTKEGQTLPLFDPGKVVPAPPPEERVEHPRVMRLADAARLGFFPKETLLQSFYEPTGEPVAFYRRRGEELPLYDKRACRRLPLPCAVCGATPRYRAKLCRACYDKRLAERRAEGDRKRNAFYRMDRRRVLFFDLELTGLLPSDEVLSVTLTDGNGSTVLNTLVRPVRKKQWRETEGIHGITPEMVKDAQTMAELAPRLRALLDGAQRLIAYGTATDLMHLKRLYQGQAARRALHSKVIDCGAEFSQYVYEHELALTHHSLTDAMAALGLEWHGTAHTSAADTDACRRVFEALFPHFFKEEG